MKFRYFPLLMFLFFGCGTSTKVDEQLVYLKSANGNFDLYTSDLLGQWEDRLTINLGYDWQANWNPGLQKMVYYTNDTSGNFSVVAMDLKTNEVDTLPNSRLPDYRLSPDGKYIFYTISEGNTKNIWRCDLEGNNRYQLTNTQSYNGRFSVSPDGKRMAFVSDRSASNELYILNLESNELSRLTENNLSEKYNSWSPDGKKIAVTMRPVGEDTKEDIYIIDIGTKEVRQLTQTPYAEQEIAWSLSGKKIAFHGTSENDGDQIYTIDLADGKFTKITSGNFYHGEPAWVPVK